MELNRLDKIDAYLSGEMDGKVLEHFLQEIKNDTNLAAEVDIQKAVRQQIMELGHIQMKEKLLKDKKRN